MRTMNDDRDEERTPGLFWQMIVQQGEYLAATFFFLFVSLSGLYWLALQRYRTDAGQRKFILYMQQCFGEKVNGLPLAEIAVMSAHILVATLVVALVTSMLFQTLGVLRICYSITGFGGQLLLFVLPMALLEAIYFWKRSWHLPYGHALALVVVPCAILLPRYFSDARIWLPEWFGLGKKKVHTPYLRRPVGPLRPGGNAPAPAAAPAASLNPEIEHARILGLKGKVTVDDIQQRYHSLMAEYHPDKVQHLGPKLKAVAEEESRRINEAYEFFRNKYEF